MPAATSVRRLEFIIGVRAILKRATPPQPRERSADLRSGALQRSVLSANLNVRNAPPHEPLDCNADFPVGVEAGWKAGVTSYPCGSRAQCASSCSGNSHPDPLPIRWGEGGRRPGEGFPAFNLEIHFGNRSNNPEPGRKPAL